MVPRLDGLCFNLLFLFFSTALLKSYFSGPWAEIITRRRAKFDDFYFVFAPRHYRGILSLRFSYHVFSFPFCCSLEEPFLQNVAFGFGEGWVKYRACCWLL